MVVNGVNAVLKEFENDKKQMRFAAAVALTRTAKAAAEEEKQEASRKLEEPTPFTLRGIRFDKATKQNLQARVYVMPIQAEYMHWQVEGGTRQKRAKSGEALPVNIAVNKYGNIVARGRGKLKALINRPDTFIGTVKGVYGLWQRGRSAKNGKFRAQGKVRSAGKTRATTVRLLVRLEPSVRYEPKFKFYDKAEQVFNRRFERELDKALADARRTAR